MEDDLGTDVSEVLTVVKTAEVFEMWFPTFERRLLVDTRTAGSEGPLLRVVNLVGSPEERFRELRRLRPRFPAPERIVAIQWSRSVKVLVAAGIWPTIVERLQSLGGAVSTCQAILAELEMEELQEAQRAVRGEEPHYRTLWERSAAN